MIDIVSVGNQKVEYKDHSKIEFESLAFYVNLAQKAIAKFGRNFSSTLSKEMLKSEDAISNVANCIMMADWRWDNERKGETGLQKTKYSYRNQCAIWAIQSYISRKKNKKNKAHSVDINNYDDANLSLLDILPSKTQSALEILINEEINTEVKEYIDRILNSDNNILSSRQSECLKLYYLEDMTFAQIGLKFGITREAVRQNIKKAIEKIRKLLQ